MKSFRQFYNENVDRTKQHMSGNFGGVYDRYLQGTVTVVQDAYRIWNNATSNKYLIGRVKDHPSNDQNWETNVRLFTMDEVEKFLGPKLTDKWMDDLGDPGLEDRTHLVGPKLNITIEGILYKGETLPLYAQEVERRGKTEIRKWIIPYFSHDEEGSIWVDSPEIDRFVTDNQTPQVKGALKRL